MNRALESAPSSGSSSPPPLAVASRPRVRTRPLLPPSAEGGLGPLVSRHGLLDREFVCRGDDDIGVRAFLAGTSEAASRASASSAEAPGRGPLHLVSILLLAVGAGDENALPDLIDRIRGAVSGAPTPVSRVIHAAELTLDLDAHRAEVAGAPVTLTELEFRLLATLAGRADRVQTRAALLHDVWELNGDLKTRTVDTHVKRVRDKLGTAGRFIETVRGIGYRFSVRPAAPLESRATSLDAERVPRQP